jgi:hypothetical protein
MTPDRNAGSHRTKRRLARLPIVLVLAVLTLGMSGCVTAVGTPRIVDLGVGIAIAEQGVTALDADQILDEYGLFYSTNRNDVVNIDEAASDGVVLATIVTNPDVKQVRVLLTHSIAPSEVGTFSVNFNKAVPGTTYYFRFYSIGRDDNGVVRRTLYAVGTHVTSNPTLKSLKRSKGTLSPSFSKTKWVYTNTISRYTSGSRITVVPTLAGSTVEMAWSAEDYTTWTATRTKLVNVARGHHKELFIRVTAPDGIDAIYMVTVKRKS